VFLQTLTTGIPGMMIKTTIIKINLLGLVFSVQTCLIQVGLKKEFRVNIILIKLICVAVFISGVCGDLHCLLFSTLKVVV